MHIISTSRAALLCTAALLLLSACSTKEPPRQAAPAHVATQTMHLTTDYNQTTYVGQVEEQSATAVSFSSMGSLLSVNVSEGQHVQKGQLLATIDPTTAEQALASAQAQLTQARDGLERLRQVHEAGSLPEVKWVEIQSQVRQAEAQVQMMRKQVSDCRVVAPVQGIVGKGICHVGETALPGQPLMSILNIDNVRVRVSIPEMDYAQLSRSRSATLTVAALDGRQYESRQITRGIEGDAMTHTYGLWLTVANADHALLPGMVAQVSFGQSEAEPALTLPVRSVQRSSEGNFVWIVREGKAQTQPVTLGQTCGNRIVILSGLEEGQEVITEGYQRLSQGQDIER